MQLSITVVGLYFGFEEAHGRLSLAISILYNSMLAMVHG
jgi:hypothetical protein